MITLNYDKMMFKEYLNSPLNSFQKGLREEICGVIYFPLVLFSNEVEFINGSCIHMQNIMVGNRQETTYRSPYFWKHIILEILLLSQLKGIFICCWNQTSLKWSWAKIRRKRCMEYILVITWSSEFNMFLLGLGPWINIY